MTEHEIYLSIIGYLIDGARVFTLLWGGYWIIRTLVEHYQKYKQGPKPKETAIWTGSGVKKHKPMH